MNSPHDITEPLEAMIDRHGLHHVLTGLVLICHEKAEHILVNWQDKSLAKTWGDAANAIKAVALKTTI